MKLGLSESMFDMSSKMCNFDISFYLLNYSMARQTYWIEDFQLWKDDKWKM